MLPKIEVQTLNCKYTKIKLNLNVENFLCLHTKSSNGENSRREIYGLVLIIIACAVLKLWGKKDLKIQWGEKGT